MTTSNNLKWDIDKTELDLTLAFQNNSEAELLKVLKSNSFLFYNLFSRKGAVRPIFREVSLGTKQRCDFAWLNDNSGGPEWVLMEVEKPRMRIFNSNKKPSAELNNAIDQVKSWERYFLDNPAEKRNIFGAVAKFRYLLVAGDKEAWSDEDALKWKNHNNSTTAIEIRTTDVFLRAIQQIKENSYDFWSFEEHPITLESSKLQGFWKGDSYINGMRRFF